MRTEKDDNISNILPPLGDISDSLLEAIPAPVFFKNENMVYQLCNQEFLSFIGKQRTEVIGKTVFDVAPFSLAQTYEQQDRALFQEGGKQIYETQVQYADGSIHNVMFHKAVVYNSQGTKMGIIGVMLDISDRRNAEEGLRLANDALTALNTELDAKVRLRTQELEHALANHKEIAAIREAFITTISHQFRTPLTVISSNAELLASDTDNPDKRKRSRDRIYTAVQSILRLLDSVHILADMEKEVNVLVYTQTTLQEIFNEAKNRVKKYSDCSGIEFILEGGTVIFKTVPDLLEEIVYQILLNAVQYRQDSSSLATTKITIKAEIERHHQLYIDISDNGIGISPEERNHIFEAFYRSPRTAHLVGIGLGLTIARKNCSLLNGKIVLLHSMEQQGSTFRITLPLYS